MPNEMKIFLCLLISGVALAQANLGELRLMIKDPGGSPVEANVTLISEANDYRRASMDES